MLNMAKQPTSDIMDDLNNHFVTLLNSLRSGVCQAKLQYSNKDFKEM